MLHDISPHTHVSAAESHLYETDVFFCQDVMSGNVNIVKKSQIYLTFWHPNFTFKFQHTLYVKCELHRNQKR